MDEYLKSTEIIDFENPMVLSKAKELAHGIVSHTEIAKSIFEWVRDQI
ncbi:MAG: Cro/Cl family transcriptional regulator, partial [Desulfobacteraceae bacterium]|nr:Cro/Cl family transcriptional regulator [Desulfobacteraceae bacterium]